MSEPQRNHRTASQRSDRSLESDTKKNRAGMWFIVVILPAVILVTALLLWGDVLGFDGPAVDAPEIVD